MSELLPILIAYSVIVTLWAVSERIGRKGLEVRVIELSKSVNERLDIYIKYMEGLY